MDFGAFGDAMRVLGPRGIRGSKKSLVGVQGGALFFSWLPAHCTAAPSGYVIRTAFSQAASPLACPPVRERAERASDQPTN